MVEYQTVKSAMVGPEQVARAFSHLIVNPGILARLGPAVSSGRAIFLYGPPGNGKTAIAETVARIIPDAVYLPHAVLAGGQVISVFDPVNHVPVDEPEAADRDRRWVLVGRPVVMCGGELTLRMLELEFNPVTRYYEAPLQMKANNGVFTVDDFVRQQVDSQHPLLELYSKSFYETHEMEQELSSLHQELTSLESKLETSLLSQQELRLAKRQSRSTGQTNGAAERG